MPIRLLTKKSGINIIPFSFIQTFHIRIYQNSSTKISKISDEYFGNKPLVSSLTDTKSSYFEL
jgi:hypothetical protein